MTDQAPDTVEQADVIAFLAAHVRRDERTCQELLSALGAAGGVRLLGHAIELVIEVACRELPGGRPELADMLTSWQERHRGSLLDLPCRRGGCVECLLAVFAACCWRMAGLAESHTLSAPLCART